MSHERTITLQGASIARTGDFAREEVMDAFSRLGDFGAKLVKISRRMDALIVGDLGYSKQPEKAHDKGIPILTEEQFLSLLEVGTLLYDEEAARALLDVRQGPRVFGEVRSILNQPRPHHSWGHLCALLDQCASEEQEPLVDYIERHMARWSQEALLLCAAPRVWLDQLGKRERAPKFRLIRALDLVVGRMDIKQCVQILASEDLRTLLSLRIPGAAPGYTSYDGAVELYKALDHVPWCEDLIQIGVGGSSMRSVERLQRNEQLQHIRRLEVFDVGGGWSFRAMELCQQCLSIFSDTRELEWLKLGMHTVELLGWALSEEEGDDYDGGPINSREYLGEWWPSLRGGIDAARGLDMTACSRWNTYTARFLGEFDPSQVRVRWPQWQGEIFDDDDLFYSPMTYSQQHVSRVPIVMPQSERLERVEVEVEMADIYEMDEMDGLVSMRWRELVAQLCIPDSVQEVVLHGGVDDRVRGWFEAVLGEGRVEAL